MRGQTSRGPVFAVTVADSDVRAVYAYLIESEGDVQ